MVHQKVKIRQFFWLDRLNSSTKFNSFYIHHKHCFVNEALFVKSGLIKLNYEQFIVPYDLNCAVDKSVSTVGWHTVIS